MPMQRVVGVAVREVLVRIPTELLAAVDEELRARAKGGERVSRSWLITQALEHFVCLGEGA